MASVDDRVVAMSFENDKFNSGVSDTIGVIGKLKNALNFSGATKGLDDLQTAGNRVDLSHIGNAVGGITNGFSVLGGAAAVVLGNIATKAITAGAAVVKGLTLDPVTEGFHNYETQINAVQTIMANTGLTGAQGLSQVNAVLKDMQHYANLTVYNFADMAKNIGTFTAAGVDLKTAQESIKGIANLAALSGSSAQQASGAMYQLSQAIAAGTVHLQDWNSVVNAGIGGKVFQEALWNTAHAMGALKDVPMSETFDEWTKAGHSFRQSLQQNQTQMQGTQTAAEKLAQAHKDAAQTISDAERSAADAVKNAEDRVRQAQQGIGDAARSAAQAIQSANDQIKSAQQASVDATRQAARDIANAMGSVKQAQQGLSDANRQASKDIATAVQQERDQVEQSAQSVQSALDGVILARQRLADAMKPPSADEMQAAQDKLTSAQLDQKDLADAVTLAQQQQTRATQDLGIAQQNLSDLMSSGTATPDQILMAQRAVQDAQQKVTDLTDAQTRALLQQHDAARQVDQAQTDLQTTQEKGTKSDKNVTDAQDALTAALKTYHDAQVQGQDAIIKAEQNVKDVKIASARAQIQAQKQLTDAQQSLSDTRIKSAENEQKAELAVTRAEQNLTYVRITQAEAQKNAQLQLVQAEHDQANAAITSQEQVAKAHEDAAKAILAAEQSAAPHGRGQGTWLTSAVLTNTLKQFSGDMTDAQLKAQGFTDDQIKHIDAMGKTATNAATQIKTFSQLMQALKEEVGTAWGAVFKTIFGDINQAKGLFSPLHTAVENFLTGPIYGLNKVLEGWAKAGGRTALIDSFKNAWTAVADVLHVVRQAWDAVFPPESGSQLANITKGFEAFTQSLIPSKTTLDELKRVFEGVFAAFDIGKKIIGAVIGIFENLFGVVGGPAGGGFLSILANIGDFLVKIDKSLSSGGISSGIDSITNSLHPLHDVTTAVHNAWEKFLGMLQNALPILTPLTHGLANLFGSLTNFLGNAFQNLDFTQILHLIDAGLLGGIFVLFKRFFGGGSLKDVLENGIFGHIKESLEGVTGTLKAMQTQLKAAALLEIAAAIGILAGSLALLATIPAAKMNSALTAMTLAMGGLVGVLAILNKIGTGAFGTLKLDALALGLIAVAGAVGLLAISVKELAKLDSKDLERGLIAVGVLLGEISLAMGPISANSAGMIRAGLGITAIAGALIILSHAVKDFGSMDLPTLGKGLGAVGAALLVIGTTVRAFPGGMVTTGLGLVAIAAGIKILVGAVAQLGEIKMSQLVQGLAGLSGALLAVALAVHSMPPGLALQGVGLLLVATAIEAIALAVTSFGHMSMDTIAKGILAMALALTVLGTALTLMDASLPGAVALGVAAGALDLLIPAIVLLGHQDIGTLVEGLGALAITMGLLGAAGLLLAPVAPAMIALGVAMVAVGAGMALIGAGVFLLGTGLSAIAIAGPTSLAILLKAFENFIGSIPKIVGELVTAVVSIVDAFAKAAPQFVTAVGQILVAMGNAVIKAAPVLANAFGALVQGALKVIRDNFPDIVKTGLGMLEALLGGIGDNIGKVVDQVADIVIHFLNALADRIPKIVAAGVHVLVKFLEGIADNIGDVVKSAASILTHFLQGIANGIGNVIKAGANIIAKLIAGFGTVETTIVTAGGKAIAKFVTGVANAGVDIVKAGVKAAEKFLNALVTGLLSLTDAGAQAIIRFLNGVADAINKYQRQIWDAGWNIAWAMIHGMIQGIADIGPLLLDKIGNLISSLPDKALKLLHIHSPSQVFYDIGTNIVQGLTNGISDNADMPAASVQDMTDNLINTVQSFSSQITDALDFSSSPTITPVLDLTQLQKDAALIPGFVQPDPVVLGALGAGQAALIAAGDQPQLDASGNVPGPYGGGGVSLIQNNYSPSALSDVEIYRQTNNLISQISNPTSSFSNDAGFVPKTGG